MVIAREYFAGTKDARSEGDGETGKGERKGKKEGGRLGSVSNSRFIVISVSGVIIRTS